MKNFRVRKPHLLGRFLFTLLAFAFLAGSSFSLASSGPNGKSSFEIIPLPPTSLSWDPVTQDQKDGGSRNPKLDSSLAELVATQSATAQSELIQSQGLRISGDRVHVQIVTHADGTQAVKQAVSQAGGQVTKTSQNGDLIQGWLPIAALESVAAHKDVYLIRRPATLILTEMDAGLYTTEGLDAINGSAWHSAGFTGAGVKIGVIDGGFDGYLALMGSDIPASVTGKNFVDGENDTQLDATTVHGTACTEIIYDIAPGASYYLAKIATNLDLVEAVNWLRDTIHVDVISTSFGFYNLTPGDGTGEFESLVASARAAGILWITSAGNDRQAHWGGAFYDADADNFHNYTSTSEINFFGPGDGTGYTIPAGYPIQVFLRWDDWTYVNQDYDLYLLRWSGSAWEIVDYSENYQNGGVGQTPTESIYYVSDMSTAYGFAIFRFNSTRNVNLEVHAPQLTRLNYILNDRSLFNLADAPSAMTVAALDVVDPYTQEIYSAQGPTNGLGGTAAGGFTKPDLSGFANISTVSYGTLDKFSGTSPATTHVAGAAALVLSAYPVYSPDQLQTFLESRAVDMGSAGMDTVYGYGRLYLGVPPSIEPADNFAYLPLVLKANAFSYFDDFSNPSSGWGSGETSDFIYRYLDGEYQIYFKLVDKVFGITPDLILPSDYRIEVDARKLTSDVVCSYGLLFGSRFTADSWETYQVLIWPTDQDFLVEKRTLDGTWTTILDWTESTAIHQDTASNHIRVDRIGTAIKIYINGVLVADLIDSSFTGPGRDAGIRAYSYYDAPVDIRFDNFSASLP